MQTIILPHASKMAGGANPCPKTSLLPESRNPLPLSSRQVQHGLPLRTESTSRSWPDFCFFSSTRQHGGIDDNSRSNDSEPVHPRKSHGEWSHQEGHRYGSIRIGQRFPHL